MDASDAVRLGLVLNVIGVIIILIPILRRVGQRLYGYFSSKVRDIDPWDMEKQIPKYLRNDDVCIMIGLAFLLIGFLVQYFWGYS